MIHYKPIDDEIQQPNKKISETTEAANTYIVGIKTKKKC